MAATVYTRTAAAQAKLMTFEEAAEHVHVAWMSPAV